MGLFFMSNRDLKPVYGRYLPMKESIPIFFMSFPNDTKGVLRRRPTWESIRLAFMSFDDTKRDNAMMSNAIIMLSADWNDLIKQTNKHKPTKQYSI